MKDFINTHFDKILLFTGFMMVLHWGIVLVWHKVDPAVSNEVFSFAHEFQGALLGLITGISIGRHLAAQPPEDTK